MSLVRPRITGKASAEDQTGLSFAPKRKKRSRLPRDTLSGAQSLQLAAMRDLLSE